MSTYSFSKDKAEFISELRKAVKDYFDNNKVTHYGNISIYLKTILMFVFYLLPFVIMLTGTITFILWYILAWVVMGVGMAGIGMVIMHDANHLSYAKSKRFNRLLGSSLYLLGGYPVTWRYQHNTLHHGFTNIDGEDEDIAPPGFLRFSPHKPLKRAHKYQYIYAWFFYSLMTISWITTKDFKQLFRYKKMGAALTQKNNFTHMLLILILSKLMYYAVFLVLPLLLSPISWYWTLTGFVLMHMVCGFILGVVFQSAHVVPSSEYPLPDNKGKFENNWAIHQLHTTCDFAPNSRIFSWFIGGLNYQIEHHLFPNISHVHYRNISVLVKEYARKHNIPYHSNRTFLSALWMHTKMLKQLGTSQG